MSVFLAFKCLPKHMFVCDFISNHYLTKYITYIQVYLHLGMSTFKYIYIQVCLHLSFCISLSVSLDLFSFFRSVFCKMHSFLLEPVCLYLSLFPFCSVIKFMSFCLDCLFKTTSLSTSKAPSTYLYDSVTRWIDYFCNIWLFTTRKCCPKT